MDGTGKLQIGINEFPFGSRERDKLTMVYEVFHWDNSENPGFEEGHRSVDVRGLVPHPSVAWIKVLSTGFAVIPSRGPLADGRRRNHGERIMKRKIRPPKAIAAGLAVVFLLAAGGVTPAHACGSINHWSAKYFSQGASNGKRQSALRELVAVCGDYAGKASDVKLLEVLRDAVGRGLDRPLMQSVFDTYKCLSGARDKGAYMELKAALNTSRCPSVEDLERWRSVKVDGALIRAGPAKKAKRIGWLNKGAVVKKLGAEGAWHRIRTWGGQTGYVHGSLLAKY